MYKIRSTNTVEPAPLKTKHGPRVKSEKTSMTSVTSTPRDSQAPRRRLLEAGILAAVIVSVTALVFYPGLYSADTFDMYRQSLTGEYHTWHSVFMSLCWRIVNKFVPGPPLFMFFSAFMIVTALYYLVSMFLNRTPALIVTTLVAFSPPFFNLLGWVHKDSFGFAFFLWFLALTTQALVRPSASPASQKISFLNTVIVGLIAVQVRLDFLLPGFLAIVFVTAILTRRLRDDGQSGSRSWIKPAIIGGVSGTLFSLLALGLHGAIIALSDAEQKYSFEPSLIYDLAGISVQSNEYVLPAAYRSAGIDTEYLQQHYSTMSVDPIYFEAKMVALHARSPEQIDMLTSAWKRAVLDHPVSYLKHRFYVFNRTMWKSSTDPVWTYAVVEGDPRYAHLLGDPEEHNLQVEQNPLWARYVKTILLPSVSLGFYDGYIYLVAAVLMAMAAFTTSFREAKSRAMYLLPSLILYLIMIASNLAIVFFLVPGGYFRYTYNLAFSSIFIIVLSLSLLFPNTISARPWENQAIKIPPGS